MKNISAFVIGAVFLTSCSQQTKPQAAAAQAGQAEPLKATVWTGKGELYLEYPALVAGNKQRFAIHLTRLADFKAVKDASCEVHISAEVFPCDPSTHPGIFGANVEPKSAGKGEMSIVVRGKDLQETFLVGPVRIAPDGASAEKPVEAKEETINFTKEQQWALDFGTALAVEKSLRENLRVAAETMPRTNGEVAVSAPIAGRVIVEKTFLIGTAIERGTELASIVPPSGAVADPAGLRLAESEARISLDQAQRDRARADRLLSAGAAPARRAEEARAVEAAAQARLEAAQARLAQYEATSSGNGDVNAKRFVVRAPISGIITESSAVSGTTTEVGKLLYRIVDITSLYVSGVVPESDFSKLQQLSGGEIEMPNTSEVRPVNRLVTIGRLVDSETRTVPVIYEVDNRDRRLAVNQTVYLRLLLTPAANSPVVPEEAVIDDGGRPIAFVQVGGETFVRRPVKLGVHNGGMVQVLEGIRAGDRVVTKGAYLIRLSTMSSSVPAHGHVH